MAIWYPSLLHNWVLFYFYQFNFRLLSSSSITNGDQLFILFGYSLIFFSEHEKIVKMRSNNLKSMFLWYLFNFFFTFAFVLSIFSVDNAIFKKSRRTMKKRGILCNLCHLIFIVSASWFEGMSPTNQYSGFVHLCNNSDKILALLLQQCYKIITSNNNFALISCPVLMKISSNKKVCFTFDFPFIKQSSWSLGSGGQSILWKYFSFNILRSKSKMIPIDVNFCG